MSDLVARSICILGRQPALGLAELEAVYGADHIKPLDGAAVLDVPAKDIDFKRLGGTIKTTRVLAEVSSVHWPDLSKYLADTIPKYAAKLPEGKFTLGLSTYGLPVSVKQIEQITLELKKLIKKSGRPVRIVPNKENALNSAQVLHNKLTHQGGWELVLIKDGPKTWLAQTIFEQDIEAYGARDQARPARDARVGMLPPKLAQIILNLAAGQTAKKLEDKTKFRVLDPFCGTGVILQEALLAGYSVLGTDLEPRMIDYTGQNLAWLFEQQPSLEGNVVLEPGDATDYQWPPFSTVASEIYLGRALNSLPPPDKLKEIVSDVNLITKKFLKNLSAQLKPGRTACLAVPAWRRPDGSLIKLPVIDHLTDMGYTLLDLKHVRADELVYFRENQVVARQLIRLVKS